MEFFIWNNFLKLFSFSYPLSYYYETGSIFQPKNSILILTARGLISYTRALDFYFPEIAISSSHFSGLFAYILMSQAKIEVLKQSRTVFM